MQFHHSTPPQNVRIRRIPTIMNHSMKHLRRNCMRNCQGGPQKVARNSIEQSFNKVRKRCNSNDLNSMFEIVAGELRAKLGAVSAMPQVRSGHDTCAAARPGRASRRRAQPPISHHAPLLWRAPEGPEGTGGLRDRPLRAKLACGDLAGGRARRRPQPSGTTSNTRRKAAAHRHTQRFGPQNKTRGSPSGPPRVHATSSYSTPSRGRVFSAVAQPRPRRPGPR